jgi:hypothetical protein
MSVSHLLVVDRDWDLERMLLSTMNHLPAWIVIWNLMWRALSHLLIHQYDYKKCIE